MAKKTVLKKVLKYAPLKSDFARGIVADEGTLRANVQDDYVEVAYTFDDEQDVFENVDPATGEVLEDPATISQGGPA